MIKFVHENYGKDLATFIENLKIQADYTQCRLDTDLDFYEERLCDYNNVIKELLCILYDLENSINYDKRISRDKLLRLTRRCINSIEEVY